jgi:hypothetical protein
MSQGLARNVSIAWLAALIYFREVWDSDLGPETGCPKVYCDFTQPLEKPLHGTSIRLLLFFFHILSNSFFAFYYVIGKN